MAQRKENVEAPPSAYMDHGDGTFTTVYRSRDDAKPMPGEVMAITNPDAKGDEPFAEILALNDSRWMTCKVVWMNHADFDLMDRLSS